MALRRLLMSAAVVVAMAACDGGGAAEPTVLGPGGAADPTSAPESSPPQTTTAPPTRPSDPPRRPPPAGPDEPNTAPRPRLGQLDVLDAALASDGTLTLEPALELFAAGYGPVPRVTPARQPLVDGGPVLRTILAGTARLDADQFAAVSSVADVPGVALAEILGGSGTRRLQAAAAVVQSALTQYANAQERVLPSEVGVTLVELPFANGDGTRNFSTRRSIATALPFAHSTGVAYDECRIRINADAAVDPRAEFADPLFVSAVAQEAYHCLQFGLVTHGVTVPLWVMEGAAAFAGEDVSGGSALGEEWWDRWITQPERPLTRRTYDAVGFFFLLQQIANPYAFADAFLTDPSPDGIRRRLEDTVLFERWGTQYAQEPGWGPGYFVAGQRAPRTPSPTTTLRLRVDGRRVAATGATATTELGATAYRFSVPGDVLVVTADPADRGGLRFADGTAVALPQATGSFCLAPGGCVCPGAPPETTPTTRVASNQLFVGVGPSPGGGPELAARSLAQWCAEVVVAAPPEGAVDQCLARRWTTTGYRAVPVVGGRKRAGGGGVGAILDLSPEGTATVVMDGTTPVVLETTDASGAVTTVTLEYRGSGTGSWRAHDGVIDVAGVDPSSFAVRVRIETPDGGHLADREISAVDARRAGYAGLLGPARYVCSPDAMALTQVTPGVGGGAAFELSPN